MWSGAFVPAKNAKCAERIPAARLTGCFMEWQRERLIVGSIEAPAAVAVLAALQVIDGIVDSRAGVGAVQKACASEIVERAEHVIVVARRKGQFEERRIGDRARRAPAKKGAIEKILFATAPGGCDLGQEVERG